MNNLIARALVALPLLAFALFILWLDNLILWKIVSLAVIAIAAKEWATLAGFERRSNICYVIAFILFAVIAEILLSSNQSAGYYFLFTVSLFWVLVVPWWLLTKPILGRVSHGTLGILLLFAAWHAASMLFAINTLLAVLILVWVADSAAYLGGRLLGKVALAPTISGGKTREGFLVSLIAILFYTWAIIASDTINDTPPLWLATATFALFCLSVIGDLFASMLKRLAGVKDSGSLLGAHGGVIDRLDALFAVLPFAALLAT